MTSLDGIQCPYEADEYNFFWSAKNWCSYPLENAIYEYIYKYPFEIYIYIYIYIYIFQRTSGQVDFAVPTDHRVKRKKTRKDMQILGSSKRAEKAVEYEGEKEFKFGWVLWHINHCRLFNARSSLYIYIKYINQILFIHIYQIYKTQPNQIGLVGFYGISTIVGYLMPNPLYTCILNI